MSNQYSTLRNTHLPISSITNNYHILPIGRHYVWEPEGRCTLRNIYISRKGETIHELRCKVYIKTVLYIPGANISIPDKLKRTPLRPSIQQRSSWIVSPFLEI
jgi:hypothetical protein